MDILDKDCQLAAEALKWHNPDTGRDVPYENLRRNVFRRFTPGQMFDAVRFDAFTFIKNISDEKTSAYSRFMQDENFSDLDWRGVFGVNMITIRRYIDELHDLIV